MVGDWPAASSSHQMPLNAAEDGLNIRRSYPLLVLLSLVQQPSRALARPTFFHRYGRSVPSRTYTSGFAQLDVCCRRRTERLSRLLNDSAASPVYCAVCERRRVRQKPARMRAGLTMPVSSFRYALPFHVACDVQGLRIAAAALWVRVLQTCLTRNSRHIAVRRQPQIS